MRRQRKLTVQEGWLLSWGLHAHIFLGTCCEFRTSILVFGISFQLF